MPSRASDGQPDAGRVDAAGDWTSCRRKQAARRNGLADALRPILGRSPPARRRGLAGMRRRDRHGQRRRRSRVSNVASCGLRAGQRHAVRLGLLPRRRDLASRGRGFGRPKYSAPELARRPRLGRWAAGHGAANPILGRFATGCGDPVREPDVHRRLLRSALRGPVRQERGGAVSRAARCPGPNGARAFDATGARTTEGQRIYQDYFTGDNALFSDSSDDEKHRFREALTFPHPNERGNSLFCTWHGKVRHLTLRLHFSWPIESGEPVYVVYAGPKLTRR